ncbi:MAG: hypothetical protein JW885_15170 [Deltaproteobacteria bacterium]|nr:hypothetical protein [Candidatus Zymogenaceae bacterium]
MKKLAVISCALVLLGSVFCVPCFCEDLFVEVTDFYVDITKMTNNYVYFTWKFTAKTDDTYFDNSVYTSNSYRYEVYYSIHVRNSSNFVTRNAVRSFYFTKDDFTILRATRDSVFGRFQKEVSDNYIVEKDVWFGRDSVEIVITDVYLK